MPWVCGTPSLEPCPAPPPPRPPPYSNAQRSRKPPVPTGRQQAAWQPLSARRPDRRQGRPIEGRVAHSSPSLSHLDARPAARASLPCVRPARAAMDAAAAAGAAAGAGEEPAGPLSPGGGHPRDVWEDASALDKLRQFIESIGACGVGGSAPWAGGWGGGVTCLHRARRTGTRAAGRRGEAKGWEIIGEDCVCDGHVRLWISGLGHGTGAMRVSRRAITLLR